MNPSRWDLVRFALALGVAGPGVVCAQDAAALLARHAGLSGQLAHSPFHRPLQLESGLNPADQQGDLFAVLAHPFPIVAAALADSAQWCDLLILHLNVKGCTVSGRGSDQILSMVIGRKFDQPLADGSRVDFKFDFAATGRDYFKVRLTAATGPMGSRDYRLELEAVPLDAQRTFVHLFYSYRYGVFARVAIQGYLATLGRDKVGFSIVGQDADGQPVYVDGMRGVIERNTMRYYLAIEAYLGALAAPPADRLEKRLRDCYAAAEQYPRQLHELGVDEYLDMKRHEVQRQQESAQAGRPAR